MTVRQPGILPDGWEGMSLDRLADHLTKPEQRFLPTSCRQAVEYLVALGDGERLRRWLELQPKHWQQEISRHLQAPRKTGERQERKP